MRSHDTTYTFLFEMFELNLACCLEVCVDPFLKTCPFNEMFLIFTCVEHLAANILEK